MQASCNPPDKTNQSLLTLVSVSVILALDQLTKFIINRLLLLHQSVPVIRGVFHLTLVHNRGAAFGILKNQVWFFILTSAFVIILIYQNLKSNAKKLSFAYRASLILILAGAIGNLIDRLILGYVIDFLDFRIWPVFNIADSAITVGAVLLAYSILKQR